MTRLVVLLLLLLPGVARGQDDVERWLTDLVGRDDAKATVALNSLAALGPGVIPKVLTCLEPHHEQRGRARALKLLSRFPSSPAALEALAGRLSDTDQEIRGAAMVRLSEMGSPAVPTLARVVEEGTELEARRFALLALIMMDSPTGLESVASKALSDSASTVRVAGLILVAENSNLGPEVVPVVGELLWDDEALVGKLALRASRRLVGRPKCAGLFAYLMRRSLDPPEDLELRASVDEALRETLIRHPPGPGALLAALWRQGLAFLTFLIVWLLLARRIPRALGDGVGVGAHRLLVVGVPLGLVAWFVQPLMSRPWFSPAIAVESNAEVGVAIVVIVLVGAGYGAACSWASRRSGLAELDSSDAEPTEALESGGGEAAEAEAGAEET